MATACGSWRRAWRRVGKAEVDMEVKAEVVEEKEEKEKRTRRTTLIKSNNPHLAGGEKPTDLDPTDLGLVFASLKKWAKLFFRLHTSWAKICQILTLGDALAEPRPHLFSIIPDIDILWMFAKSHYFIATNSYQLVKDSWPPSNSHQ